MQIWICSYGKLLMNTNKIKIYKFFSVLFFFFFYICSSLQSLNIKSIFKTIFLQYRCNQKFINTYLAEKEALKKEKERWEHMQKSAIKIQAWWRGVMVRRKLGPYRLAEKKKKRPTKTKRWLSFRFTYPLMPVQIWFFLEQYLNGK